MTRNIRKIVSVICAVALLLSLCAVSFVGGSSALHLDAVESDNSTSTFTDYTEVFDWTLDGETPAYWDPNNNNYLNDSDKTDDDITQGSYVDADGLHFSFAKKIGVRYNSKSWASKSVVVKDNQVVGESKLADAVNFVEGQLLFKSGFNYIITMKYKPELIADGTTAWVSIGYGQKGSKVAPLEFKEFTEATDEWQYMTTIVSGDTINGDFLHVGGGSDTGSRCSFLVESVTVRTVGGTIVLYETAHGDIDKEYDVVPTGGTLSTSPVPTNIPEDKGFAGWCYGDTVVDSEWAAPAGIITLTAKFSNTISAITFNNQGEITTSNLSVGLELSAPERPNHFLFFEGWYSDVNFTKKVTTVPDYDATLYAKYNGAFLNFDNVATVEGQTTGTISIVEDPADPTNSVAKFTSTKGQNQLFMIPAYDCVGVAGFELKPNTSYVVTYKVKLTSEEDADATLTVYQGDLASGTNTVRTEIKGCNSEATSSTEWTTVTNAFTTGSTLYLERVYWAYQNHVFLAANSSTADVNIYIDDFCIAEQFDKAPEGTVAINIETNANAMPSLYGYVGEAVPKIENPVLGGYAFVGWYSDKNFTVPFDAANATFGTKDITIYAKWEKTTFHVDFTNYETITLNARAKLEKDDNGNNYIDWWYNHKIEGDKTNPYAVFLDKDGVQYRVTKGNQYTITFKYKLLEDQVKIYPITSAKFASWTSRNNHKNYAILLDKVSDEWQEASFTFTADPTDNGDYLTFGIAQTGHILVDDIRVDLLGGNTANVYGSTTMLFNTNGGNTIDMMSGDPGEAIPKLPTPKKNGYMFNGWYTDAELTTPFTDKVWGEKDVTLYADWVIAKFDESFEDYPNTVLSIGISGGYKLYNSKRVTDGFDKSNVHSGSTALYRDGSSTGNKAFTLCRSDDLKLTVGKQYTLTFYVKPESVTDAAGTISLIGMSTSTGIVAPKSTNVITTVGELKAGKWQKVTYTFTADNNYIGISTTAGNNMYFDNFTVNIKDYVGTTTGDTSVSPIILVMLVVLAAGSLLVTGKKVFEK